MTYLLKSLNDPLYMLVHPRRTWEVLHDPEFHAIIMDILSTLPPLEP